MGPSERRWKNWANDCLGQARWYRDNLWSKAWAHRAYIDAAHWALKAAAVEAILADAEALAERMRAEGWTRADFARELGGMLGK